MTKKITAINADKTRFAHELVVETAKAMAGELYELTMRDNVANKAWATLADGMTPKQREAEYIALAYPKLLDDARHTLAGLLGQPIEQGLKDRIYDALIKDSYLRGMGDLAPKLAALTNGRMK